MRDVARLLLFSIIASMPECGPASPAAEPDEAPTARGPFVVAQPTQTCSPAATATQVEAVFRVSNPGPRTVAIISTTTTCGCTSAASDRTTYRPGESGLISATFAIGDRFGRQRAVVHVRTDAIAQADFDLTMLVDLPAGPTVSPAIAAWRVGDVAVTRDLTVRLPADSPFRLTGFLCGSPRFAVSGEIAPDGLSALAHVTPQQTAVPVSAAVELRVSSPAIPEFGRSFTVFAAVLSEGPGVSRDTSKP